MVTDFSDLRTFFEDQPTKRLLRVVRSEEEEWTNSHWVGPSNQCRCLAGHLLGLDHGVFMERMVRSGQSDRETIDMLAGETGYAVRCTEFLAEFEPQEVREVALGVLRERGVIVATDLGEEQTEVEVVPDEQEAPAPHEASPEEVPAEQEEQEREKVSVPRE